MLQELSVVNFAIISSLRLEFQGGMTVLTGETGAGKSIIIDAMGLLVGGRGSSDYIREGASKCTLEGLFTMPQNKDLVHIFEDLGIEIDDEVIVIQRDIWPSGKNICRVNGRLVNLTNLRKIGTYLVDIHGQNEHQELMQSDKHICMLDDFGGLEIAQLKQAYLASYQAYFSIKEKIDRMRKNEKEFAQRMDMLRFQKEEIEASKLVDGEEEALLEERNKLVNFQKIVDVFKASYAAINEENDSSIDRIGLAMNELLAIEDLAPEYKTISETVQNSYYLLQEVSGELLRYMDQLEFDEQRLNEVEIRLEIIRQMKRKYGDSISSILTYHREITKELEEVLIFDDEIGDLEELLTNRKNQVITQGKMLSEARNTLARDLEQRIISELGELYLERTVFDIRINRLSEEQFKENGMDEVEFYITTNPGEPLKPLVKVASGGELSRIMLALKTIFSTSQGVTSIIFDEVDTGVSGRVAQAIADKIHQISKLSQVLCITHLPQVAAVADYQYFIEKEVKDERTQTQVKKLTEEERVIEIARMLSGSEITQLTKEHAKELLSMASQEK